MRRRYRQLPDGKLVEISPGRPSHSGTFQVGDLPDMMKDVERRKADHAKAQKRERLQTIVDTVNRYAGS